MMVSIGVAIPKCAYSVYSSLFQVGHLLFIIYIIYLHPGDSCPRRKPGDLLQIKVNIRI